MSEHQQLQKWIDLATKQLKGKSPETLNWMTPEGIEVKPLYTYEDLQGLKQSIRCRDFHPMRAAPWPPCMPEGPGRFGSMPAFLPQKSPMNFIGPIWLLVRWGCRCASKTPASVFRRKNTKPSSRNFPRPTTQPSANTVVPVLAWRSRPSS